MAQATPCPFPSIHSILASRRSREARLHQCAREKETSMNISSLLVRSSLWGAALLLAWCGSTNAATSQATDNQETLLGKSSIVFSGTVSQLAATSFADVPRSEQTIVVRVDSIMKKPPAVSLKRGDSVTVEVKDASAFQEGAHATFYTDGWIFGSGIAVKELGHVLGQAGEPVPAPGAEKNVPGELSEQELKERISESDFVVVGRVTDVHKWNAPKKSGSPLHVTEHDPDWHEAVVEIQSVLKGGQ